MPFKRCPSCGEKTISLEGGKLFQCSTCGFQYFHNVATAAGAIVEVGRKVLFIVRAMEPAAGQLALPGGFVDPYERAEDAVVRECREELGWKPDCIEFMASFPNQYLYREIEYNTCDLFFITRVDSLDLEQLHYDRREIAGVSLLDPEELDEADLAFGSTRKAIRLYLELRKAHGPGFARTG